MTKKMQIITASRVNKQKRRYMSICNKNTNGLKRLIKELRSEFRRPENTEYYTEEDYRKAEKKYIKYCLVGRLEPHQEKGSRA
jgi:hypothetical protein